MKIARFFSWLLLLTLLHTGVLASDTIIYIRAISGLQYDIVRFKVAPGAMVKIILENDDDMSHNLVITKSKLMQEVVLEALKMGDKGPANSYIPNTDKILFKIPLVEPGQTAELSFKAPITEGVYPYVCTYPGHGFIMYGAIYVGNIPIPLLHQDPNIPETRRRTEETSPTIALHPYMPTLPIVYRTFMPDCGPAAIAVGMPGDISYCWDAGICSLRYGWAGGFIDNMPHWKGNGNALAKIIGETFYISKSEFAFRFDDLDLKYEPQFKGYSLVEGYPRFEYEIEGIKIKELIQPLAQENGFKRSFEISGPSKNIYFVTKDDDGVNYEANKGKWDGKTLILTPEEGQNFIIHMKAKKGSLK